MSNVDMQEPLSVEDLTSKVLKLELLLEKANQERARVEQEAKEEREVLHKQLNAVTVDHDSGGNQLFHMSVSGILWVSDVRLRR